MKYKEMLESYEKSRRELLEEDSNLVAVIMNERERQASECFEKLKAEYLSGNIRYELSALTDENARNSRLYKFCSQMPKGADLHVHDMALLPAEELVDLLAEYNLFCINTDKKSYDLVFVPESEAAPKGYMRFAEAINSGLYTKEEIKYNWTVASAKASKKGIWDFFEDLFCRQGALSDNPDFAAAYYDYTFRYYCKKNIMHVEIHMMLTESIKLSANYIKVVRDAYYKVKRDYPYFTVRIIGAGVKADNEDIKLTKRCFLNTAYVQETIKDEYDPENPQNFVIGFDLVNEEDSSLPLKAFAPMLIKVKRQFPEMELYIHGGESIEATNENLVDAYLLGVSRVGHGLNLYRYPNLHKRYVKSEICLEVCPVSNQALGYTKDLRNHPATEYLRSGVSMALCSDDPAFMENETLTDDFFAAVVSWNLSLADIKQLAINSLMFSGLNNKQKRESLKAYNKLWNGFIDEVIKQ